MTAVRSRYRHRIPLTLYTYIYTRACACVDIIIINNTHTGGREPNTDDVDPKKTMNVLMAYGAFDRSFNTRQKCTKLIKRFTDDDCLVSCRKRAKRWRVHIRLYCERGVQVRASEEWRWLVRGGDDGREVANRANHTGTINVAWYTASLESDAPEPTAPRRAVRPSRRVPVRQTQKAGLTSDKFRRRRRFSQPRSALRSPGPESTFHETHSLWIRPPSVAAEISLSPAQPVLSRYQTWCCCCSRPCFFRSVLIIHSCFR